MLKMFGSDTGAGTSDSVATIDVPDDCELRSLQVGAEIAAAAASISKWELSFASSSAFATNDTRSSIATIYLATPTDNKFVNQQIVLDPPVKLQAGERLHLHNNLSAIATTNTITLHLHTTEKHDPRRRRI